MRVLQAKPRFELYTRAILDLAARSAKAEQSQRGWYDEQGIRQGGLIAFVRYFWNILEPETPFSDSWVLWSMVEHLEAVTFGDINRLLINVPPGSMKSLLTNVFWPAWEWGPMGKAHLRYVTFSYSATLTERDNNRFTSLITSDEYQALYGSSVEVVKTGEKRVSNTRKGWKLASSIGGVGTGERGDRVILDDPNNVKEAESETVRSSTIQWFRESMSNRLNDLRTGAIICIMQRVHSDDISGCILSLGLDYCHLCIPMEYDWGRQVGNDGEPIATHIGWVDPRYVPMAPDECDGTLAWPERFPPDVIEQTKQAVGPYAWAGQYQQQPAPRGGGLFKRSWWQLWESADGKFPVFEYILASLDSAYTEREENDPSALTVWGIFRNDQKQRRIMLVSAWRKHLQFSADRSKIERGSKESINAWRRRSREHWGLMEWVVDTCDRFKVDKLLIEAKASGISAAQELANRFGQRSWGVQLCPVSGDKYARALAVQPTFSQLMVYAPERDWSDLVIEEMEVFPKHKYKDLTDSTTQAIKHLRDIGLAQTDEEAHEAEMETVRHKPKAKPLYQV
jgi:predicted phage terminase large subunit-like protein